jgi:hypothetical protein
MNKFGLYPQLYVKKKDKLFPLIEKYSGQSMAGKSHGEVIQLYYDLLNSNPTFTSEVDKLANGSFKNADGFFANLFKSKNTDPDALQGTGYTASDFSSGASPVSAIGGASPAGAIAGAIGTIFGFGKSIVDKQAKEDEQFMDIILNEQKKDDTTKILVVSGITLAIIGMGVFLVLKLKKS